VAMGPLTDAASNGAIFDGKYWYVAQRTDALHMVTLRADGTVAEDVVHSFMSPPGSPAMQLDFGDIDFDSAGLMYLVASVYSAATGGTVAKHLATYNLATRTYTVVRSDVPTALPVSMYGQIAMGPGNVLYNHVSGTGELMVLSKETGDIVASGLGSTIGLTDVGARVCSPQLESA
jgi:hypothetical protein